MEFSQGLGLRDSVACRRPRPVTPHACFPNLVSRVRSQPGHRPGAAATPLDSGWGGCGQTVSYWRGRRSPA